jgi:hypothetical protein
MPIIMRALQYILLGLKYLLPLSRRFVSLLLGLSSARFSVFEYIHETPPNIKLYTGQAKIDLELKNAIFLRIDNVLVPIFKDGEKLHFTIPTYKNKTHITLCAVGVFGSQIKKIAVAHHSAKVYSPTVKKINVLKAKKLHNPINIKPILKKLRSATATLRIKNPAAPALVQKNHFAGIKQPALADIETQLKNHLKTTNKNHYEQ